MCDLEINQENLKRIKDDSGQRGSAIVIAVFVLVLLGAFVALALTRTATEAAAVGNEASEARTFYAAQGSLEMMTRNFNKVFETKLSPTDSDFNPLRSAGVPGFTAADYTFSQEADKIGDRVFTPIDSGPFAGLYATQDNWQLRTTATDARSGIQVQLTRNILNNRIPIFQFGIFYNDNMELHPGARFDFGGRVHSNGSLFLMTNAGIYFDSRVSAVGEVITDTARNGASASSKWGDKVYIKNGGSYVQLKNDMGSVLASPKNGAPVFQDLSVKNKKLYDPDMPALYENSQWLTVNAPKFGGNLLSRQKSLDLPLRLNSARNVIGDPYIELIKRGKNIGDLFNNGGTPTSPDIKPVTAADADSDVTVSERYYNKTGIRVTLANSKAKLPGCASGAGTAAITGFCGVRLDGASVKPSGSAPWGSADTDGSHGYQPIKMADGYQATRLNGERFRTSAGEVWIKIELISKNATTNKIIAQDVTEDILSLGVTEAAPCISGKFQILSPLNYCSSNIDSRSIIKLQRFVMQGANFVGADATSKAYMTNFTGWSSDYASQNVVFADECTSVTYSSCTAKNRTTTEEAAHKKKAIVDDSTKFRRIVPFPIEMFDAREGVYNTDINLGTTYPNGTVPWAGVMSIIDIDVANFKKFLEGNFNNYMPASGTQYSDAAGHALRSSMTDTSKMDVPQDNGWVVYVSDRRGDYDFDGEYDMEDVYGNNDGILQTGEDVNGNNSLDVNYTSDITKLEVAKFSADGLFALPDLSTPYTPKQVKSSYVAPGYAASVDHPYYRRGVRLINGEILPGKYDWQNSDNTKGFTVATENGIYVQGNYNARGISSVGTPTKAEEYLPQGKVVIGGVTTIAGTSDGQNHVPASIAADAITILSNYDPSSKNGWNDAQSFLKPFDTNQRKATETTVRFAILAGDAKSSLEISGNPNQGASEPRLGGGVHNFKRFLEAWGGVRMNYCGSLINLYNSHNNNGTYKVTSVVYGAPTRNWVFDTSFLDPTRLPPGTPYFQYIQTTGFRRTNS